MTIPIVQRMIKGSPSGELDADLIKTNDAHFSVNANKQLEFHADQLAGNAVSWARDGNNDLIPIDKLGNAIVNDVREGTSSSATQAPSEAAVRGELDSLAGRIETVHSTVGISDTITFQENVTLTSSGNWGNTASADWEDVYLSEPITEDMIIAFRASSTPTSAAHTIARMLGREFLALTAYPTGIPNTNVLNNDIIVLNIHDAARIAVARASDSRMSLLASQANYDTIDIVAWKIHGTPGPQGPRGHDANLRDALGGANQETRDHAPSQRAVISYVGIHSDSISEFVLPAQSAIFDNPYSVLHADGVRMLWLRGAGQSLGGYDIGDWKMVYISWNVKKSPDASASYDYVPKRGGAWILPEDVPTQEATDNSHPGPIKIYDNRDLSRYFEFIKTQAGILIVTGQHGFPETDNIRAEFQVRGVR